MRWHVMHKLSIHFCVNLKKFCCPFCCHLMSVHLPWNCHLAESSKIANLKTTPLLTKLYNIVKFPSIQLRMKTSPPSRPGLPILCIFLWSGIAAPPATAGCQTNGCALEFFIHTSKGTAIQQTWEVAANAEVCELSRRWLRIGNESGSSMNTHLLKIHHSSE